jgi:fatty acid-binding protein DegV
MKELGYAGARVCIDHCNNEEAAKKFAEIVHLEYPEANIKMGETYGLCSFYAEEGGLMIGFEKNK